MATYESMVVSVQPAEQGTSCQVPHVPPTTFRILYWNLDRLAAPELVHSRSTFVLLPAPKTDSTDSTMARYWYFEIVESPGSVHARSTFWSRAVAANPAGLAGGIRTMTAFE